VGLLTDSARSDAVKDTSLKAKATAKDFTYKATGNKIKIKQRAFTCSHEAKAEDSTLKAKAKTNNSKIVLEDPRRRGLVLEDSYTVSLWWPSNTAIPYRCPSRLPIVNDTVDGRYNITS